MKVTLPPGKYVVAVSGGVDSMVLLDLLMSHKNYDTHYVVAHFDHGIRADSAADAALVRVAAVKYRLPCEVESVSLGSNTSEARARQLRYAFLEKIRQQTGSDAILTAHHQNDLIETIVLNIGRGTGRYGLDPLRRRSTIMRPLLSYTKDEILAYAQKHNLAWREDSTNTDDRYVRNRIRKQLASNMSETHRTALVALNNRMHTLNYEVDNLIKDVLRWIVADGAIVRARYVQLPHSIRCECILKLLRDAGSEDISSDKLHRIAVAAAVLPVGRRTDIDKVHWLVSERKKVEILRK